MKSWPSSTRRGAAVRKRSLQTSWATCLFVLVNLARFVKVDPEQALRGTNAKFRQRFGFIERKLAERGRKPQDSNIEELEALWQKPSGDRDPPVVPVRGFAEAVRLQQTVWGFDDIEMLPLRSFVVYGKIGGQLFGAYDGGALVAFLIAVPGIKPGPRPYLHSHMLGGTAGLAECRDRTAAGSCGSARKRSNAESS